MIPTALPQKQIRLSQLIIPKFWPAFNDQTHGHIILDSGRAGTKSSMTAIRAIYDILDPAVQASTVIVRKRHNKLRSTVFAEARRAIGRLYLSERDFRITVSPMRITYKPTGNSIFFAGSDSPEDTKGIIDESRPIRRCFIDEVSDFFIHGGLGRDELQNIEATFVRGNPEGFQTVYAFNPPKNPSAGVNVWAAEEAKSPDTLRVHVDYRDVPPEWLGPALLRSAELLRQTDEKQWRWLWLGEPVGLDDAIYYMFSEARHVKKPEGRISMIFIGADYGQMNATTFQAFGLDEQAHSLMGLAEYYHSGRDEAQKSPGEYAGDFAAFAAGLAKRYGCSRITVFIDPSAKGLSEEIKRAARGAGVLVKPARNDVRLGISRVQKLLTFGRMSFSPAQVNAIREIRTYEYDPKSIERGEEKPMKQDDHAMDAMRYAIMGAWKYLRPYLPQTGEKEEEEEEG